METSYVPFVRWDLLRSTFLGPKISPIIILYYAHSCPFLGAGLDLHYMVNWCLFHLQVWFLCVSVGGY